MLKKIILSFASIIMVLSIVIACAADGTNPNEGGGNNTTSSRDQALMEKDPNTLFIETFSVPGKPDMNKWTYCYRENNGSGGATWNRFMEQEIGDQFLDIITNEAEKGGYLELRAYRDNEANTFRTSGVHTKKREYGLGTRTTVRAKLSDTKNKAGFPAIWYYPYDPITENEWVVDGEIDMMEWITPNPDKAWVTVHHHNNQNKHTNPSASVQGVNEGIDMTAWHTYTCDILTDKILLYVDGKLALEVKKQVGSTDTYWPFNTVKYNLILNASFHDGSWGGDPNENPNDVDYQMYVDFVKIEKIDPDQDPGVPTLMTEDQL